MRRNESSSSSWHVAPALALVLGALAFLGSCPGEDDGATLGPALSVPLVFRGHSPAAGGADGWSVTLDRAEIALGRFTIYGNTAHESVVAGAPTWFGGAPAYAHAGHAHGEADASAELEGFHVLDLLATDGESPGELSLPPALYFDGKLKLARAAADGTFSRPGGGALSADDPIVGHTLLLEGTATDATGGTHDFRLVIDAEGWVAGLEFDVPVAEGVPAAVSVTVRLDALLALVDFEASRDAGDAIAVGPDSSGYTELKAALLTADTYVQTELLR